MTRHFFAMAAAAIIALLFSANARAWEPMKPRATVPEAMEAIDRVWSKVGNEKDLAELDQCIEAFEEAARHERDNAEVLAELAALYFRKGDTLRQRAGDFAAGEEFFSKSYETATRSLELKETPEGHYYAAISLGAMKNGAGTLTQVRIFPEVRSHIEWIGEHENHYFYGARARFWCECMQNASESVIGMIGVGKEDTCSMLDQAIGEDPGYLENYFSKLECCVDPSDKEAVLMVLGEALSVPPSKYTREMESNNRFRARAMERWTELTGKKYPAR